VSKKFRLLRTFKDAEVLAILASFLEIEDICKILVSFSLQFQELQAISEGNKIDDMLFDLEARLFLIWKEGIVIHYPNIKSLNGLSTSVFLFFSKQWREGEFIPRNFPNPSPPDWGA
jgi:hypothetical protein